MKAKTVDSSRTTITELMIPAFANFGGKVHGGILLSLMDKVAYAVATKHSGAYCVTVSVDGVEFRQPVEVGELLSLNASLNFVGNSSMIIGIRIESLNPKTGVAKHTNSSYFTMVAKDDYGNPMKVPKLILQTNQDIRRFWEGIKLRKLRRQIHDLTIKEVKDVSFDNMAIEIEDERCIINKKV